ncbi:hypothetical protein CPAST_c18620 [Clostridium pasteurianum DSM 525 = ATCC 6013]|uniref:Division initiation protein n=1 Tax=Clostridium pasteurianum DSM 525 = ATCC 6013 TaxID=1262449 RepID=A0A0H3J4N2_CLOPA|nr:DUF881 domain-containing protein [Clostridium pasteurianum]AJA47932.1 hypothetical protein CPAST_c18620 [Clostridium pasteurianum DSM 525 = ATCC 6013]AJA51920.1 hypothetical protein CLPA_c18620 [Clostridium pasteurianum DSM 525 = ATCC 6013]AOZ75219.1 division initiation protein [Clostridium pasteurianum DSM 525 = ATCC 6013]AOZ79014.1 division initiation protein [Clostridium pasteurianum]ELP59835.1 hypothetical protein F502_08218 [Clostridium pasteurianum DSM 525 = ATCC 6013]
MKNNESTVFVFVACIIIGILITSNFNFSRTGTRVFLNAKQYQDQYNYKNTLLNQINELRDNYFDLQSKIGKLSNDKSNEDLEKELKKELDNARIISGEEDVEGPGIKIVLNDDTDKFNGTVIQSEYDLLKLIHNYDVSYVVNDLQLAGAEAISVNGQRIASTTEIYCIGAFIRVNGVQVASPFYIDAIGDKDKLKDYMMSSNNYLYTMINRGIKVKLTQNSNIKINGYNGDLVNKYLKSSN